MIEILGAGDWISSMAGQLAWQSTAVLALGLIASSIVAMRPSRSHRILLAATLACLVVPPASLLARWFDVGLISPASPRPPLPIASRSAGAPVPAPGRSPGPRETAASRPRAVGAGVVPDARPALRPPRIDRLLLEAWAILAAFGLLRLTASFAAGLRLKAGAEVVGDPDVIVAAGTAAKTLGLSRTPEVRASGSVRCPVVWCWGRRPVLILPQASVGASSEDRSDWLGVLCHELAHWKRADHVSGLVSELLTCLFPWQPLAWVVRGRMAGLSELACDDWALAHAPTVTPHDYAEALLQLASEQRRPLVPAAVSRRSGLGVRVRHILEEAEPRPRTGVAWSTVVAGLAIGLVAVLALARTRQARAVLADRPAVEAAGDVRPTTIHGRVRRRSGEPIAGADVYCIGVSVTSRHRETMPGDDGDGKRHLKVLNRGTTDARGQFSLEAPITPLSNDGPWTMVVAHKPGLAPTAHFMEADGKPIELVVEPAVRISGRLLGPGGDPAPGVAVRLEDYTGPHGDVPVAVPTMEFGGNQVWAERLPFHPDEIRTDDSGRFVLDGFVPDGVFARLVLSGAGYAVEDLMVSTAKSSESPPDLGIPISGPVPREFTHALAPARPVTGRVTDVETKAPLAGVKVEVTPMRKGGGRSVTAVTDAEGRYRVADREGETYWVTAYPARGSGYLAAVLRGTIKWPEGEAELRIDMGLRRGVVLRGRVVDEDTSKPIPYASVTYQSRRGNPHVRDEDHFDIAAQTDAAGRFAVPGVPGPGVVVAEVPTGDYIRRAVKPVDFGNSSSIHVHAIARLEVPAAGEVPEIVMTAKRGFTLKARAVRPDGSAPSVVRAWCPELSTQLLYPGVDLKEFSNGQFELNGAEPGRSYRVFFLAGDQKHGAVAELKADPARKEPAVVRLRPTATLRGRVLDADGTPIVGAQVLANIQLVDKGSVLTERDRFEDLVLQVYNQFTGEPLKRVTPAEFRYNRLIPGVRYFVTWYTRQGEHFWHAVEPLGPGEDRDVGDMRADRKERTNGE